MPDPVPAATVILLRPGSPFEVLMVERNGRGMFGDITVFPGGRVDDVDVPDGGSAVDEESHRRAAIRELAEETGILLTADGVAPVPAVKGPLFYEWLEDGVTGSNRLVLVSRWVTPEYAPRRYDTRFYLASCVDPPDVRIDGHELVGHVWRTPADALELHDSGQAQMILPTLAHLRWLARRTSPEDALDSARGADGRTLIRPERVEDGSLLPIHMPAERLA